MVMSDSIHFTRNLVKGRIAETIFAQMFRENGNYTVLEFGYEKVVPQLVGLGHDHSDPVIETLRVAPDFAVIKQDTGQVRLIEVKFRSYLNKSEILTCAAKMHVSWNPSFLFVASLDGFYFDEITKIIENEGEISLLEEIPESDQANYLKILQDFESQQKS